MVLFANTNIEAALITKVELWATLKEDKSGGGKYGREIVQKSVHTGEWTKGKL